MDNDGRKTDDTPAWARGVGGAIGVLLVVIAVLFLIALLGGAVVVVGWAWEAVVG